jgi:hypothetical protein
VAALLNTSPYRRVANAVEASRPRVRVASPRKVLEEMGRRWWPRVLSRAERPNQQPTSSQFWPICQQSLFVP